MIQLAASYEVHSGQGAEQRGRILCTRVVAGPLRALQTFERQAQP